MSTISEKLNRVNNPEKNEVTFQVKNKDKSLYDGKFEIPLYAGDIVSENEEEFYYFFKDMEAAFVDKINKIQKDKYLKS